MEPIQHAIRELAIPHLLSEAGPIVSISLGVVSQMPAGASSPEQLIHLADQALYRAKAEGRDRYVLYDRLHSLSQA